MAPAVERREHSRRHSPERSISPVRERKREKERGIERSPRKKKSSSSRSARSPARDRSRSPDHAQSKGYSRSPSPRSKRLRRVRGEREAERLELDRDRSRERGEERRSGRDKDDGGSSRRASWHEHSASPQDRGHRSRRSSRSPTRASKPGGASGEVAKPRATENLRSDDDSIAKMKAAEDALKVKDKAQQKPSFELSGKLAEETNRVRGVTLLFNEPPDARKPDIRWRLYVFKAGEVLNEPLYIHRQSCYLFGRERRVADIPTDHPSCSKQHAVLQYRFVEKEQPDGLMSKQIRPYIMDLGSTNGTFINDNRVEPQRYYELFEKDTIKFGNSSREYVILHENSMT